MDYSCLFVCLLYNRKYSGIVAEILACFFSSFISTSFHLFFFLPFFSWLYWFCRSLFTLIFFQANHFQIQQVQLFTKELSLLVHQNHSVVWLGMSGWLYSKHIGQRYGMHSLYSDGSISLSSQTANSLPVAVTGDYYLRNLMPPSFFPKIIKLPPQDISNRGCLLQQYHTCSHSAPLTNLFPLQPTRVDQ